MPAHPKHPMPHKLKGKNIYWRPGQNTQGQRRGSYVYEHFNENTKQRTRTVLLRNVKETERRSDEVVAAVLRELKEAQKQYEDHGQVISSKTPFPEAWKVYLEDKQSLTQRHPLKHSTVKDYESAFRLYLEPFFGELQMKDFNTARLRAFVGMLTDLVREPDEIEAEQERLAQERAKRWEGMTRREALAVRASWTEEKRASETEKYRCRFITVKREDNIIQALKSFLSWASEQSPPLTSRNLSEEVRPTRTAKQVQETYKPTNRLRKLNLHYEDMRRLLAVLDDMAWEKAQPRIRKKQGVNGAPKGAIYDGEIVCHSEFVETALYTGMRAGELVELRWSDISFLGNEIRVSRAFTHGKLGTTKNSKERSIPMIDRIWNLLAEWSNRCPSDQYVFPNSEGNRLCIDNFRARVWKQATERAGMPGIRIHDLRHLYAAWLVSLNIHPANIQYVLSHQSWSTTKGYLDLEDIAGQQIRDAFNAERVSSQNPKGNPNSAHIHSPSKGAF